MVPTMTRLSGSAKARTSRPSREGMLKGITAVLRDTQTCPFETQLEIAWDTDFKLPAARKRPRPLSLGASSLEVPLALCSQGTILDATWSGRDTYG